jgi:hypothetical protein
VDSISTMASVEPTGSLCPLCMCEVDEALDDYVLIGAKYFTHADCVSRLCIV